MAKRRNQRNVNRDERKRNRRERKKGGFWKTFGIIVASTLLSCLLLGVVSGGAGMFEKKRNEANLLDPKDYTIKSEDATGNGLSIDVCEDGSIKIKGETTASDSRVVSSVTLPAGTYTISGVKEPDKLNFSLYVEVLGQQYHAGTGNATFTLDSEQTVNVILSWGEDYKVPYANRVITPCIVEGQTAGEFYAK